MVDWGHALTCHSCINFSLLKTINKLRYLQKYLDIIMKSNENKRELIVCTKINRFDLYYIIFL